MNGWRTEVARLRALSNEDLQNEQQAVLGVVGSAHNAVIDCSPEMTGTDELMTEALSLVAACQHARLIANEIVRRF